MALVTSENEIKQECGSSENIGFELCGKIALWCTSDCTTALHLTCLRPRQGALLYVRRHEKEHLV